jgi:hypothetical protein
MTEVRKKLEADAAAALAAASESLARVKEFYAGLADKVVSNMGELGSVINAVRDGFAAGGPWGALAALGVDLMMKSKQFAEFVEKTAALLGMLADGLGFLLGPILKPLFEILRAASIVILAVVRALAEVWNFLLGWTGAKVDTAGMDEALDSLVNATWDNVSATEASTDAINEMVDALTNVPEGYKVALSRFNAMDASSGVPSTVSGGGINININGITDPDEVAAAVERVLRAQEARATRQSISGSRFAQEF